MSIVNSAVPVRIEAELSGSVVSCSGELLTAISPKAFPPGKPLQLTLLLPDAELTLSSRAIGSKKRDDGQFDLRVRLINLRREARATLAELFSVER